MANVYERPLSDEGVAANRWLTVAGFDEMKNKSVPLLAYRKKVQL